MTFSNITREPTDNWIGTGIAETVSSDLKNIHGLTIIGRARVYDALRNLSSDAHLKDSLAIDIGRRLGATWVVMGGYQRIGSVVRITASVVEIATGAVTRTVKVDGKIDDIFALQDKIVFEVSEGLNVALRGTEIADIERQETQSVAAYESYARGMMNLRQATRESIDRAIAAFDDATKHDPEYARAWAALGGAYGLKGNFPQHARGGQSSDRAPAPCAQDRPGSRRRAHVAGCRASRNWSDQRSHRRNPRGAPYSSPRTARRYQTLARAYWVGIGDFKSAIPMFERAIELNPEAGYSYLQLSLLLAWDGQLDRAEEISRRAVELQEQYISGNLGLQIVGAHARLGYVHYLKGEYVRGAA